MTLASKNLTIINNKIGTARWLLSILIAVLVTGFLAWSMNALINVGTTKLKDSKVAYNIDFVRVQHDDQIKRNKPKPKKPPQPQQPPPEPPTPKLSTPTPQVRKLAIAPTKVNTDIALNADGFSLEMSNDSDYMPIAKVAPIYPRSALRRGIEGYCTVVYTVKADGSVFGVRVVENECTDSSFKQPSIEAAKKFRYKPREVNGVKVDVPNVQNQFNYQLQGKK